MCSGVSALMHLRPGSPVRCPASGAARRARRGGPATSLRACGCSAWSDGTSRVRLSRTDFVGKLAAIVPPPRSSQTVYHGVLAVNAGVREAVAPVPPERTGAEQATRKARRLPREPSRDTSGWADLLLRVFGEDVLACRHCRGPLTLRAVVVHPRATTPILVPAGIRPRAGAGTPVTLQFARANRREAAADRARWGTAAPRIAAWAPSSRPGRRGVTLLRASPAIARRTTSKSWTGA